MLLHLSASNVQHTTKVTIREAGVKAIHFLAGDTAFHYIIAQWNYAVTKFCPKNTSSPFCPRIFVLTHDGNFA